MTFSLHRHASVEDSVVRVAHEQLARAIHDIEHSASDRHHAVHEVRKRCKKLRALIRLVRPALGDVYTRENACYRDAARSLSYLRDAQTLVESFDDLLERCATDVDPLLAAELRVRLIARRNRLADDEARLDRTLDRLVATLRAADARVPGWSLAGDGFDAVAGGVRKTYKRGRKAMQSAVAKPTGKRYHEWRKRVKYHAHHLRLLRPLWTPVMKAHQRPTAQLADLLGDDHDLVVLRETLAREAETFGDERKLGPILGLINRRQTELRGEAHTLGKRVFAERPDALIARLACYWDAWRAGEPEPMAQASLPSREKSDTVAELRRLHGIL